MQTVDANSTVFASVGGFWHSATASTTITHSLSNAARVMPWRASTPSTSRSSAR